MKKLALIISLLAIMSGTYAQKVLSAKSSITTIELKPTFERGLPPNLFVDLSFQDENNNGILEVNEIALLNIKITNNGKGAAQGLTIKVSDSLQSSDIKIGGEQRIPHIASGKAINISFPIKAGYNIETVEHKLEINIEEHFGYDMNPPAYLILNTLQYQEPQLVFSGLELMETGEGTAAISIDGKLQAGEMVKAKLIVQNVGQNIAKNTKYKITTTDKNIYLSNAKGELGDLLIGEVKEFWVTISPNRRTGSYEKLPIYLSLENLSNKGNLDNHLLPIKLNSTPPKPEIVEVTPDINSLQKKVARFEYNNSKITANVGTVYDVRQVTPAKTKRDNAVAIIIGVEKYKFFAPAPYAENDASLMKEYFKNVLGVKDVYVYTNEEVSGYFFENIFNAEFGEIQKAVIPGETDVFVFYSGHGMPSKTGEQVFLFPYDGRLEAINYQGYNLNKFYTNLSKLDAKSVTVFIDACFSGISRTSENHEIQNLVAMKGVSIKPKIVQPWENHENFTVFTSSSFDQTSLGFDHSETGLFTYFITAGLQGHADKNNDKKVTSGELKEYVISNVMEISTKIHGLQTPQFYGKEDLILTEY